ncbi:MAG: hypothetical protein ISS87_00015 [Candidatus Pacebacteria bacterium]|nr:hypothetical protein [Candidatus Paceibacterota bacterium]
MALFKKGGGAVDRGKYRDFAVSDSGRIPGSTERFNYQQRKALEKEVFGEKSIISTKNFETKLNEFKKEANKEKSFAGQKEAKKKIAYLESLLEQKED